MTTGVDIETEDNSFQNNSTTLNSSESTSLSNSDGVCNTSEKGIFDVFAIKYWALKMAADGARTVLSVDQVIKCVFFTNHPHLPSAPSSHVSSFFFSVQKTHFHFFLSFLFQIIMSKPAGGPKAPQGGNKDWDED